MGCDIHLFVEKRVGKNEDGEDIWEHVPGCRWYETPEHCAELRKRCEERGEAVPERYLHPSPLPCFDPGRNYDLFAMLADVRNGRGFAGCDTGDGFVPVLGRENPTRDFPRDASDYAKARAYEYGQDGHSHSYLTLAELLAYDTKQTTKLRGVVDYVGYIEFKEKGAPDSWCGAVGGPGVQMLTNEEMERHILDNGLKADVAKPGWMRMEKHYTRVEWERTYHDCAPSFFEKFVPELQKLGAPEDVRIVYFFDN